MSEERPVEPFSDLHVEEGQVRATLLHDPTHTMSREYAAGLASSTTSTP